jgi:hypothetical protein
MSGVMDTILGKLTGSLREIVMKNIIVIAALFGIAGCATTGTDGVVKIGPDMYMLGGQGKFSDFSSSWVKARLYQDGAKFCEQQGKVMVPINSTGQDSGYGTYASAEIQFRCVGKDDPHIAK